MAGRGEQGGGRGTQSTGLEGGNGGHKLINEQHSLQAS